jgi:hypothetical protein
MQMHIQLGNWDPPTLAEVCFCEPIAVVISSSVSAVPPLHLSIAIT